MPRSFHVSRFMLSRGPLVDFAVRFAAFATD